MAPFQTELAIDTNIRVADTQTMVEDTKMTVTDTQVTVTNIEKRVADMHRDMLVGQKGAPGQNNSVGGAYYL